MEDLQVNSLSLDELQKIHTTKQQCYDENQKKWKLMHNISVVARIIAVLVCIGTAIYGYYTAQLEEVSWFLKLLAIVIGAAGGVCIMGILFLLLKPIFWLIRKSAKNTLSAVDDLQRELYLIKHMIMQNCADNHKVSYTKEEYQARKGMKSSKQLSSEWLEKQKTILEKSIELRNAKLEGARFAEWQWVISAVVVAICAIALIVSYILLALIVVIGIVVIAIASTRKNDDYYYRSPLNTYDEYEPEKQPFFDKIIEKLCGRVWAERDYYDEIVKEAKKEIKKANSESKEILSQLTVWNYPELHI